MFDVQKGVSPNVVVVNLDCSKKKEHWFLLRGDCHHDNPKCDQALEKKHLDEALEREAGIIDVGDLHCVMGGKYDPRASKAELRPEYQRGDYFDAIVREAANFYQPYAKNIVALGYGNHETSVMSRMETNLTERLAQSLRDRTGALVPVTGYTGWVRFRLFNKTTKCSRVLWHCHGYGGGGPVTKDTIQAQRQHAYVDGADILLSGHVHERWMQEHVKVSITDLNEVRHRSVWYVKTGTYKNDYCDGSGGWHVITGKPPKPLGAWWLKLTFDRSVLKGDRVAQALVEIHPTT